MGEALTEMPPRRAARAVSLSACPIESSCHDNTSSCGYHFRQLGRTEFFCVKSTTAARPAYDYISDT
jgi:hypothetical protein